MHIIIEITGIVYIIIKKEPNNKKNCANTMLIIKGKESSIICISLPNLFIIIPI